MATISEVAAVPPAPDDYVVDPKRDRLVIVASSLGTVFEWYDFFIYGMATVLAQHFFPWAGATGGFLYTLAAFRPVSGSGRSARSCSASSATAWGANTPS